MRIPSLDGLRALSIALVMLGHLSGTTGFIQLPQLLSGVSFLGVRVFFIISGFLITSLLLEEEARTRTVSLGHFYFRRTMRIFPPFYVFVACMALAGSMGWIELREHDILAAVTYTMNYHQDRSWFLGHTWSLAVEEQFYLLWPLLMKYLGSRRAAHAALVTVVCAPLVRIALLIFAPGFREGIGETFPTVADAIATGCLLAFYRDRIGASSLGGRFLNSRAVWITPVLVLGVASIPSTKFGFLVGQTLANVGIALVLERVVRSPGDAVGRFLNTPVVIRVGVLSYSLYLWQQPFLNRYSDHPIAMFPLNVALACVAAAVSYRVIERPALRLRTRSESHVLPGMGRKFGPKSRTTRLDAGW